MKLVIAAATRKEIQPLISYLAMHNHTINENEFHVLITGVGSLISSYHLAHLFAAQKPDYCIQAGVAGTFSNELSPGQLVLIREEVLADLGAEEAGGFNDIFDLGLTDQSAFPFTNKKLINPYIDNWGKLQLPIVNGLTVNEISTRRSRIDLLQRKYGCQVESMEGAAFHYACLKDEVPFLQIRAISNYVGDRDKKNWKMKEAVNTLNDMLIQIITSNLNS